MIATSSPVVRLGVRAASPLAVVVAIYLFFAGHNQPGGGFAAGLVLGAVAALRTVAGLFRPAQATRLLAVGGVTVVVVAIVPLLVGGDLLDMRVVQTDVPLLDTVKTGSALIFDAGVTLIVVGLVVAVLQGLGASELAEPAPRAAAAIRVGSRRRRRPGGGRR